MGERAERRAERSGKTANLQKQLGTSRRMQRSSHFAAEAEEPCWSNPQRYQRRTFLNGEKNLSLRKENSRLWYGGSENSLHRAPFPILPQGVGGPIPPVLQDFTASDRGIRDILLSRRDIENNEADEPPKLQTGPERNGTGSLLRSQFPGVDLHPSFREPRVHGVVRPAMSFRGLSGGLCGLAGWSECLEEGTVTF